MLRSEHDAHLALAEQPLPASWTRPAPPRVPHRHLWLILARHPRCAFVVALLARRAEWARGGE